MIPDTEIRTLAVSSSEPTDRTSDGTVVGTTASIDLGAVDTTDEAQDSTVSVFWWRVTDINGAASIRNIRVWISDTTGYVGTNYWYMDITDTWTPGKTAVQVKTGTPGLAPTSVPAPNVTKIGVGDITGITHDQTSGYIYITGNIGVNETTGTKSDLKLTISFDHQP